MANDYFQFKQFLVKQDKCAMKVCTDACLFGAWAGEQIKNSKLKIKNVLDVGTGTGLLSLMLAQKNSEAFIDAFEIDEAAAEQAKENFEVSAFSERLFIYNDPIKQFAKTTNKKYDVIICNPPFYENDLKSENRKRNLALHSDALNLEELVSVIHLLIADEGSFFVLLPFHRTKYFEDLLVKYKLFILEKVLIKQTPKHNYFRTMFLIDRNAISSYQSEIIL